MAVVLALGAQRAKSDTGGVVAEETVDAIWRIQRVEFTYHSSNVYYSCSGLQSKIRSILKAVGAHHRVLVDVHCMGGDFVNHAFARVTVAAPTEATHENVRAATTYDARTKLVARLRKVRLPTATDIERFPAEWQTVSLSRHRGVRLDSGDCDLLRSLRDQVFPRLSIRVTTPHLHCTPGLATRLRPRLEVMALIPAPAL